MSSEFNFESLYRISLEMGFKIEMIAFVREPFSYLISAYSQALKMECFSGDFYNFIEIFDIENYFQFITKDITCNLKVLNYESCNIFDELQKFIGLHLVEFYNENTKGKINPSLNSKQMEFIRVINNNLKIVFGNELVNIISNSNLLNGPSKKITTVEADLIRSKFEKNVNSLNDKFKNLNLSFNVNLIEKSNLIQNNESIKLVDLVTGYDFISLYLKLLDRKMISLIRDDSEPKNNFNQYSYLLNNYDVLQGKFPPYGHFISHGIHEGRYVLSD
jgi:hypothetical protein